MAQGRLIGILIALAGVAVEVAAPGPTPALTAGDYLAGASLALVPAFARRQTPVAVLAAAAWFAATLSGSVLLAHRGPLLHLLAPTAPWPVVVAGYAVAVLPIAVAGPATGVLALMVAARSRSYLAGGLGAVWLVAAFGNAPPDALAIVLDALVMAVAVAVARGPDVRGAVGALAVDLGPGGGGAPVGARLASVLADPDLAVRFRVADGDWIDEAGRSLAAPEGGTRAAAPGGGEVALVHGPAAIRQPTLERAAAQAAALALDAARLAAESRRQSAAVRASGARLLAAADVERRALVARLREGPLPRLDAVERLVSGAQDGDVIAAEVRAARAELLALASGLFPAGDRRRLIEGVAARTPVPVTVSVTGDPAALPDSTFAVLYFVAAEALVNVAKHARAQHARLTLDGTRLEVVDDGRGGAELRAGGGLAGLADRVRVLGGRFAVASPPGGGTIVTVEI